MRRRWPFKAALSLVPKSWRPSVAADLEEEAHAGDGGPGFWRTAGIALRMRAAFVWDAASADVRYAVRGFARGGWFTIGAVLTFALGIGVTLGVFAMLDRILFRPLPYDRPDQLVLIAPFAAGQTYFALPRSIAFGARARGDLFADVAHAGLANSYPIAPPPDDRQIRLTSATYNALRVLGLRPVIGRDFSKDDAIARAAVALMRYETWQQQFGGGEILGRTLGRQSPIEIVGILPAGFIVPTVNWGQRTDGLVLDPDLVDTPGSSRGAVPASFARLATGATIERAQAAVEVLAAQVESNRGAARTGEQGVHAIVGSLQALMFSNTRTYLWLLVGATVSVLLIACANLSSLFLARGRSREPDLALLTALGASRARLASHALIESLLIATAGGTAAVVVLAWTWRALVSFEPSAYRAYAANIGDGRVIVAAIISAAIFSLVAGLLPAIRATRVDLRSTLQQGARTAKRTRSWASISLLVAETAFGMLLVTGAVLTSRSLVSLLTRDLGFRPDNLFIVEPRVPRTEPTASRLAFYERARAALQHRPGVESVAGVDTASFGGSLPMRTFASTPRTPDSGLFQVTGGYFETIGATLLAGRPLTDDDVSALRPVAVVTRRAARVLWPDIPAEAALGRMVSVPNEIDREVVGVVGDPRRNKLTAPIAGVYVPFGQPDPTLLDRLSYTEFVVRMRNGTQPDATSIGAELRADFPGASFLVLPVSAMLDSWLDQPTFQATLFGAFAMTALLLAAVGLYAVASFDVAQRRYEMGVRLVMGASPAQVRRLVFRTSLLPVVTGVVLGLIAAWWAGRFLQSLLDVGQAHDPLMMALAALTLVLTGVVAAWRPARRAASVDPVATLRAQ